LTDTANGTQYFPTCNNPVAVTVLNNNVAKSNAAIYVVNDPGNQPPKIADTVASSAVGANGTSTINYGNSVANGCSATTGQITAFQVAYSGGTISAVSSAAGSPFAAGSYPTAIISDTQAQYVYVTDFLKNQLLAYAVTATGGLTPIGQFPTGNNPDAITIDPLSNTYIYVANYTDNSVSVFKIGDGGTPQALSDYATGTGPSAVYIEPNVGHYLYTGNFLDNTVTGLNLSLTTGALNAVQSSAFPANGQPTSITAVTHGSRSSEALSAY
jgi:hypothetical protein